MSDEISIAEVDQAEAALADAKNAYRENEDDAAAKETFLDAKRHVVAVRSAWRKQEEDAGNRGLVGGDATTEEA